jgi:hypothetical protein
MSELRRDTWEMPAADLGRSNPLPPLERKQSVHARRRDDELDDVMGDAAGSVHLGHVPGPLPYARLYGYNRDRRPRAFPTAVLENDVLRATFLLELGGRMWSLFHKPSRRELLYTNPVFQPGNLGTVDVWFAGGVEWNCGIRGHSPLTCSPVWAARAEGDDGPILRLYAWERARCIAYQIDCWLPDGSPWLFVRPQIMNHHDREIAMYWWSNIAVPELDGGRVVVPATETIRFGYDGRVRRRPVPVWNGVDLSYVKAMSPASDSFYVVDRPERPWISLLDADGRGLVQVSTPRLLGRKLFRWGHTRGGRNWQRWLSPGGTPYVEIQAGLTRTQAQCRPMPPHQRWSWLEAYGPINGDPARIHGDWAHAVSHVCDRLDATLPPQGLDAMLAATDGIPGRAPAAIVHRGDGWGALERRRREAAAEPAFCSDALVFDDASLGDEQRPWLALLDDGALPEHDPSGPPVSWMVQPEWRERLRRAVAAGRGDHWASWLHLGVMAFYHGEQDAARAAWERSLAAATSAWAYRNLGVLARHAERPGEAADHYLRARALQPDLLPLAYECANALIEAGRARELLDLLPALPAAIRGTSRMRLYEARAAVDAGELERAAGILDQPLSVTDLREGERTSTRTWYELQARLVAAREGVPLDDALRERVRKELRPPEHLDFRMSE